MNYERGILTFVAGIITHALPDRKNGGFSMASQDV